MIRLNATTPEGILDEFKEKRRELSIEIVTKIMYAIDNSLDNIEMDVVCSIPMEITANVENYQKALTRNSETLLEYEEYEILSKMSNYINNFKSKQI